MYFFIFYSHHSSFTAKFTIQHIYTYQVKFMIWQSFYKGWYCKIRSFIICVFRKRLGFEVCCITHFHAEHFSTDAGHQKYETIVKLLKNDLGYNFTAFCLNSQCKKAPPDQFSALKIHAQFNYFQPKSIFFYTLKLCMHLLTKR